MEKKKRLPNITSILPIMDSSSKTLLINIISLFVFKEISAKQFMLQSEAWVDLSLIVIPFAAQEHITNLKKKSTKKIFANMEIGHFKVLLFSKIYMCW